MTTLFCNVVPSLGVRRLVGRFGLAERDSLNQSAPRNNKAAISRRPPGSYLGR